MKAYQSLDALPGHQDNHNASSYWWAHVLKHRWVYLIGALGVIGTNAVEVSIPLLFKKMIDSIDQNNFSFRSTLYFFIGLLSFQFVCRIMWRRFMAQQTHVVSASMKAKIWDQARYFDRSRLETDLNPGELMNVAAGDVGSARYIYGFTLVMVIDFIFLLIFSISAMLYISPMMTGVSLILMPILPLLLRRVAKAERVAHDEAQNELSRLSEKVAQSTSTVRLQRLSQSQNFWSQLLKSVADSYQQKRWAVVKTELSFFPMVSVFPILSYAIMLTLGLHLVFQNQISIGDFIAFQSLLLIIQDPLIEIGPLLSEWQRGIASLNRVLRTLKQPISSIFVPIGTFKPSSNENILVEASNLSFSYQGRLKPVIDSLNFDVKKGERLGIKGPIGSGKSTLFDILAGFQRDYSGHLKITGSEVKDLSHESLRSRICMVPQKPFLFATTIRRNLALDRHLSSEEAQAILEIVDLWEDVQHFPLGLDTSLGEWGINLSGGQKQRLTLARALVSSKEIILLDDCLSAVDTKTEDKILENLNTHYKQHAFLWIAHRSSTLRSCSKILEF